MALILLIETSSPVCSAALSLDGQLVALRESGEQQNHASVLAIFIESLFKESGHSFKQLSAVAVSAGPGSYTGLRIGVSAAKGLCYALNIPLITIDSLDAMMEGYSEKHTLPETALLCPLVDARRMEVYYALFSTGKKRLLPSGNAVLNNTFLNGYSNRPVHFFGSGTEKAGAVINKAGMVFKPFILSASYLIRPAFAAYNAGHFADVAYFEPNYIKPVYFTAPAKG